MKDNLHDDALLESAKSDLDAIESATGGRTKLRLVKTTLAKIRTNVRAGDSFVPVSKKANTVCACNQPLYGVTI